MKSEMNQFVQTSGRHGALTRGGARTGSNREAASVGETKDLDQNNAYGNKKVSQGVSSAITANMTVAQLRSAIVMKEVLDQPLALRRR